MGYPNYIKFLTYLTSLLYYINISSSIKITQLAIGIYLYLYIYIFERKHFSGLFIRKSLYGIIPEVFVSYLLDF